MTTPQACKLTGAVLLAAAALFLVRTTRPAQAAGIAGARFAAGAQTSTGAQARITQPIDDTAVVKLRGNVHPLARAEFDRGAVADSVPMNRMLLVLERSPEQEAALEKLLTAQQIKGSPNFHHWLTPEEFAKQFGPADADVQKITQWLGAEGFSGIRVARGRTAIEFSGNVGQVRNSFNTEIHRFAVGGKLYQANVGDPSIPAALAPVVAGIASLNNFPRRPDLRTLGPFKRTADGRIVPELTTTSGCGTSGSQPCYALGPADFATIYNSAPLASAIPPVSGAGVLIGVVGDSNIDPIDVSEFRSLFGLPPVPPANIILDGPDPGRVPGAETEGDLDVEWSGAVAPGARIDFVVSEDTLTAFGGDLSALYIVDNNSDDILSASFSACEAGLGVAGNLFYNALWEQAAAQGITVVVAAGDGGSAGCDNFDTATKATLGIAVNGVASTPFDTAVGGTDFDDAGKQTNFWNTATNNNPLTLESAAGYIPEITWNDSCAATAAVGNLTTCASAASSLLNILGGSGGPSQIYPKPAFQIQSGLTPADNARDTPDVSFYASVGSASNSFYVVCEADLIPSGSPSSCASGGGSFSFISTGGTSAATPAFAGVMALIDQDLSNRGLGRRQGNANVILYKIAQGETFANCNSSGFGLSGGPASCPFNDITKGNDSVPCAGGSPNCSTASGTTGVLVAGSPAAPAWTTATGYDLATGLGTININNLATAWPVAVSSFTGTATTLTANGSTTITHGQSLSFTATVSPTSGTGTPTGDVTLLAGEAGSPESGGFDKGSTLSNGTATITTSSLPGGSYPVTVHYAGDTTFAPSDSSPVLVTVTPENSGLQIGIVTFNSLGVVTMTNAPSFAYGSPYILRMDVLNSLGASGQDVCQPLTTGLNSGCARDATGSITVTDNGAPLDAGTFGVNSQGDAEDQPIQLPAGTHTLSASYSGDVSYNASGPVKDTVTVSKAATSTTMISSATSIVAGGTVVFDATVNSNSNSSTGPSGTVQFQSSGSSLGSPVTCTPLGATLIAGALCTATLTTTLSALPPGLVDTRPPQGPPAVLLWLAALGALLSLLVALRLPARRRGYACAGVVLFLLLAGGFAGCGGSGSSAPAPRIRNITAQYSGDGNYATSTSPPIVITVR
jgi:subtilase family serine protease